MRHEDLPDIARLSVQEQRAHPDRFRPTSRRQGGQWRVEGPEQMRKLAISRDLSHLVSYKLIPLNVFER